MPPAVVSWGSIRNGWITYASWPNAAICLLTASNNEQNQSLQCGTTSFSRIGSGPYYSLRSQTIVLYISLTGLVIPLISDYTCSVLVFSQLETCATSIASSGALQRLR